MNTWSWRATLLVACFAAANALATQPEPVRAIPDWHASVRQFARRHFKNPRCELPSVPKVPQRVVSPAGRALVGSRQMELSVFLEELKRESADYRNL